MEHPHDLPDLVKTRCNLMQLVCRIVFSIMVFLTVSFQNTEAQEATLPYKAPGVDYSDPDNLGAPPSGAMGFPSVAPDLDVRGGFQDPPPGYGQVPFWWWSGDPLDRERLLWQIEQLHDKGIPGMQVNYIHRDTPGWPTYPAEPEIFTEPWWEIWAFVAEECRKRDMGIGLSGYTLDWPGTENLFNRIIYNDTTIQGRELVVDTVVAVTGDREVNLQISGDAIAVWAYPVVSGHPSVGGQDLEQFIRDGMLDWSPGRGTWEVWIIEARRRAGTLNPVHPQAGRTVIDRFFQQFEDHAKDGSSAGLNYFFQDELKFGVDDLVWSDDFAEQFQKHKGYDVYEAMPALFADMGPITPKVRLDFMDVKVRLSEERYFMPIFEWHRSRGKIYGCDPEGRGLRPGEYGDNFQAQRWYTAPGHDTPGGRADLIKGKISSSIAALYKRPRVWLEGYHSLGWGATPERLMFSTNENYLYGCNLLNLHGLYYTTHGSFWEWAPPCYHFRMPYWHHMDAFFKYFERLSYLLSQGTLQADVAIVYPVSPAQADWEGRTAASVAFESGTALFNHGYDFMFIDHQSIARSKVRDGQLQVSGHQYRMIVLPAMQVLRWTTLQKALALYRSGGVVVAVGALPRGSDRAGSADPELDAAVREIFGISAAELDAGVAPAVQEGANGGIGVFVRDQNEVAQLAAGLLPKRVRSEEPVRAMHRKVGFRDVYMVMGASKGSWCTFRSKGMAEWWDPWTGYIKPIYEVRESDEGTMVRMPLTADEAQIIVFSPGSRDTEVLSSQLESIVEVKTQEAPYSVRGYVATPGLKSAVVRVDGEVRKVNGTAAASPAPIRLEGDWQFDLAPTMDNRWGDFRLPVREDTIGAEARAFRYMEETSNPDGWELPDTDDNGWPEVTYGFGQKFWKLGPLPQDADPAQLDRLLAEQQNIDPPRPVMVDGVPYQWSPYAFSWRWGIEGDPGHQGWHGLKESVTDDFICLGKPEWGFNETVYVEEEPGSRYYLWTSAYTESAGKASIKAGGMTPEAIYVNGQIVPDGSASVRLRKGSNPVLLRYESAGRGHFVFVQGDGSVTAPRTPLSMTWYDMPGRVCYDVRPSETAPAGWYRFVAPPGLRAMTIRSHGAVEAWQDGHPLPVMKTNAAAPIVSHVEVQDPVPGRSLIALRVEQSRGSYAGSTLPEPVLLECGPGIAETGDWSRGSALQCYSGGAWYRTSFALSKAQAVSGVMLDLGDVVATAEVRVNGSLVRTLVSPPWEIDISEYVREGENRLEVLVYNTLANHYHTVPTRYKGETLKSGLIGPVRLHFRASVVLR